RMRHGRQIRRAFRGAGGTQDVETQDEGRTKDGPVTKNQGPTMKRTPQKDESKPVRNAERARPLAIAGKKPTPFARVEDAIEAIRAGRMVIVVDDADRENEGDLTIAAEKVTPEAINFMARYGRGLICLSMTPERLDELEIPLVVSKNTSAF